MVNNRGYIIHKANHHKKGRRHDYMMFTGRIICYSLKTGC